MVEILKMNPVYKNVIWGGTNLRHLLNKAVIGDDIGESWELSCHPDGLCGVANGEYAGKTLREVIEKEGPKILGTKYISAGYSDFPLLIKFIDANDKLSVQVHPDDAFAKIHEGEYGKTEMWHVVWAKPGAKLVYGFKSDIKKDEFEALAKSGEITDKLNFVEVLAGDSFFIEAGKVHAIGEGILIYEIQENSNSTYRLYDWGRMGSDGKPRRLDIDKAAFVAKLSSEVGVVKENGQTSMDGANEVTLLKSCSYFSLYKIEVWDKHDRIANNESFEALTFISGSGVIRADNFSQSAIAGDSFFVPANFGGYEIQGRCSLLIGRL